MQKFLKRAVALFICSTFVMQAVGCNKSTDTKSEATAISDYGTVWSAPSTVKIDQYDIDYEDKGKAELIYNAVKNEYESHQLLITAAKEIKDYYLEISDLKCESQVLSKDNITVYNEKYLKFSESAYGSYSMPDALIPIDTAKEYGELTIEKDKNAAFWVTVYIPKDTPAGLYEGNFTLTVEDAKMDIPVQVNVNDYTLPDTTSGRTLFSWRYNRVGTGELDSSIDMMKYYYEFFLDYRISLQEIPIESINREEVIAAMDKYYDRMTSYALLAEPGKLGGEMLTYKDNVKEMILAIASISTAEKNLFDKAMIYTIDEPNLGDEEKYKFVMTTLDSLEALFTDCIKTIEEDKTGQYDNFKKVKNWKESITDIPNIMPLMDDSAMWLVENQDNEKVKEFFSKVDTICPAFGAWDGDYCEKILALCERYDVEHIWWYGGTLPLAPSANYHIGNGSLLDARSYSWLQLKYGIEGNLYWDAAAYTSEVPNWDQYMNVYENPVRIQGITAGDGYLTYPGAPYGIYGPIPSVRLMSIRDGMEELEMLNALKQGYEELESVYGSDFSAEDSVSSLINKLYYNGSLFYVDGEKGLDFNQLRSDLIDSVVWNNMGIGFALMESSIKNNIAELSYYIAEGCKIYIDDQLQQPVEGCRYEYQLNLEENTSLEMTIEAEDGTKYEVSRFISYPTRTLQAFDEASALEKITVTEGGTVQLMKNAENSTDGTSAQIKVNGKVTGNDLVDAAYIPTVSIDTKIFENMKNLADVSIMNLDFYNPGEAFKMTVKIYYQDSFVPAGEYTINNGKTTVSLPLSAIEFSHMSEAERIVFEFENSSDGKTVNQYTFYIDNVIATD